jgi:hypothetical protein
MPFKKGESGNPEGRKPNEFREALRDGLIERLPAMFEKFDKLDGKEWFEAFSKIAPYGLPKLSSVEVTSDNETGGIVINVVNAKRDNDTD